MKNFFKKLLVWNLVLMMVFSTPIEIFAQVNHNDLTKDKSEIINKLDPVKPAKLKEGQSAADLIKNPKQPDIYTLRTDYKVQNGERYRINYQPYIASVGEAATQAEKDKVNKEIKLPDFSGYEKPDDESFTNNYDDIVKEAKSGEKTGNEKNGFIYKNNRDFKYKAKTNKIKVKHVFQKLDDFTQYANPDGSIGKEGERITIQSGNTGSTMEVTPLEEKDRKGFIPESGSITMQVPENDEDFILEYRYNRAHYDVNFDTAGGTAVPSRTLYYEQVMPSIVDADIPTKVGGEFQGWKPSVELESQDGSKFKADEIIKDSTGKAILNLDAKIKMPASNVTFTAVWKDKDKAGYAVQFWAEKADHADGASLADKYDFIGTRVYKDQATGSRPDLDNEPVKDIVFTDLDHARLNKIWAGARFNRGKDLYLNKFYVYNQDLTHEQNADPANVNLVKSVDSTGKTVYNIYYDRQVYELYFTKSNAQPAGNTFYPEIWGYDEAKGEVVKKGGPGNPYHYKARFNQLMLGWPNDAMQTKGFSKGMQSFGWGPNYTKPNWPGYLDTPPYRLNADEFLDMKNYDTWGGYTKPIDKGDGTNIDVDRFDFTTLSFGINQAENSMPHHMDFWMDGFKDGEIIIRYDLYRFKADTNSESYRPKYPKVQGFTGKRTNEPAEFLDEGGIDDKNDEREEVTPFPAKTYKVLGDKLALGKMKFINFFFSDIDEFGDPLTDEDGEPLVKPFEKNGYLKFEYSRNKYQLRFNYDPLKIKGDSEFNKTNSIDTFYEFPLKALSPDVDTKESYNTDKPANLLDNPEKLQELKLTDLIFTDPKDGKLKVKRPDNLSDQMVFKGWALDPAGSKLIWENPGEKMPNHPVNLYAKWGEPDYKWKVTFDPNGGKLSSIDETKVTQKRKTIQEGDIGKEEKNTYAKKEANEGDKQVFTVIQRQKLVEPKFKPTRKGYDFMGWEVIHYKRDAKTGDYTNEQDTSYRDTYKVPELYSFGNDVVSPIYLKAIWVKSDVVDIESYHHFLDKDYKENTAADRETQILRDRRVGSYLAAVGSRQNDKRILVPKDEWDDLEKYNTTELQDSMTYAQYKALDKENPRVNSYSQQIKIEPEKIQDQAHPDDPTKLIDNPKAKLNQFHFYYRPFRQREYKVNYLDERGRKEVEDFIEKSKKAFADIKNDINSTDAKKAKEYKAPLEKNSADFEAIRKKYAIIDQEAVKNGKRHFDARNYRPIAGWVLNDKPQQQLFFDIDEDANAFFGINETGLDEINFFYKDVRVVEVKKDDPVPDGYVRVTFKAADGGSFGNDAKGDPIKELYYDVIKGLRSQLLPVPKELKSGETKDPDKYYITPDDGKKFIEWDQQKLLNDNTVIEKDYTFTAQYDWSDLKVSSKGLVTTESYEDPNGTWTNKFAPTIEDLKKQLVLTKNNSTISDIDNYFVAKFYDDQGNELKTDEYVLKLLKEKGSKDMDELVSTVNIKAKVKFKDEKFKSLEKEAEGLGDEIEKLNADIAQNKKKITELNKEIADKEAEKANLSTEDPKYQAKIAVLDQEIAAMRTEIANLEAKIKNDKKAIDKNKNDINTKTTEINKQKGELNTLKSEEAAYIKQISSKEAELKPLEKQLRELNEKITVDSEELNKLKAEGKLTADEITKKEAEIQKLKGDASEIEGKINPIKADLSTLKTKEAEKKTEITKKEADINKLEKEIWSKAQAIKAYEAGLKVQELDIPVTIYKNVYEALTNGDMPKVLKDATTAPDGDLVNVTGKYVKVTVQPTNKPSNKDAKIYYVNPKAWVEISKVDISKDAPNLGFTKWTADKADQNETSGEFDFAKRHKFTEDTVITPNFSEDVKEQKDGEDKPDVPGNFVKVIVEKTIKADLKNGEAQTQTFWVNPTKEVTIPVTNPTGKTEAADSAAGAQAKAWMFEKWTSDETPTRKWNDTIKAHFKEAVTNITANYKQADNIIKYDPEDPITKPDGYVRVKFDADEGLTLKNAQYYYVKKNSGVKLSDLKNDTTNYGYPTVDEKTGYKFDKWNPADTTEIGDKDITVTAKATKLDNVVPDDGNPNTKPKGYKEVTFVIKTEDADKGSIDGVAKFFVKPNEYVKIDPPATKANTGFEFGAWDENTTIPTIYDKDTTITGSFNGLKDLISKTKTDDSEKPAGYKTVTFVIDPATGGKIADDEITVYYVNPAKDVTVPQPKTSADTGYKFDKWDQDTATAKKYTDNTTVKGNFKKLDDIIPSKDSNGKPNAQPEGYVTVTFTKGTHGSSITGETIFYVNPNANKTLANITPKPTVIPDTGYAVNGWDKADDFTITGDITVNAKYDDFDDVIPEKDEHGNPNMIPFNYVKVTFDTTSNGTIENSTETTKVVFVKPNTAVALKRYEPKVEAKAGYDFTSWDVDLTLPTVYNSPRTIKAIYNDQGNISKMEVPGYVKVEFRSDSAKGTLQGDTNLWVKPNTQVTLPTPNVTPIAGHTFTGWDKKLTVNLPTDLPAGSDTYEINAQYSDDKNIILKTKEDDSEKPKGYVKVTFRADDNGKLVGDKDVITYFVNPNAGIKLVELEDGRTATATQLAVPKTIADENYKFEKWYESLDTAHPIMTDQEYVARFKLNKVTLTYNEGEGTGTLPIPVIVDHGTKVRLAPATGLSKADASFKGWKLDGDETIYQPGDEVKLEKARTATAQWTTDEDIIEYDPVKNPTTRPVGTYVRVTFEADNGLGLTNQKAYYVKANKGITLKAIKDDTTKYGYPSYKEETGYEFKEWDLPDSTRIEATDIVVKAKATKLERVIPEKDNNNQANKKPDGYKEVTFVIKTGDESKGSLEGNTKFYVNPNEYVTINNPPKANTNRGFEFGAWSPDPSVPRLYTDPVTTITANFNELNTVIPKTKTDDSEKPKGYVTVTFVIDPTTGGKIVDGETTVYYVKPNTDVTIKQPDTIPQIGYEFEKWDQDTVTKAKQYTEDTTVKGNFKKLDDIIPSTDNDGNKNAKPGGYITVTFDKGEHGSKIEGQKVYYVNPKAGKTIGDTEIAKPTVTPETGWKQKTAADAWDPIDATEINGPSDIVVKAQYEALPDVIVKTADDDSQKPDDYITVTFDTTNKGRIKYTSMITKKVLFVNPNKAIVLKDKAPGVVPKKGYEFSRWDVSIDQEIKYKDGTTITALYNEPGDISTKEVYGYVKVEFKQGEHGSLQGQTTDYWIKPGVEVNIPEPTVDPNVGFKFKEWDKPLTVTAKANDPTYEITAGYTPLDDIIPEKNIEGLDRPKGYFKVTFKAENGTLAEPTIYYVNPNKEIWLEDSIFNKMIDKGVADIGYTSHGHEWYIDGAKLTNTRVTITEDKNYTYKFAPLPGYIEKTKDDQKPPKGYVIVTLIPTDKAKDEPKENKENKIYFVNPLEKVTLPEFTPKGKQETDANGNKYTYEFNTWTSISGVLGSWPWINGPIKGTFTQDTDIEARYTKTEDLAPIAKKGAITQINVEPKPEDLITNVYDPSKPDSTENLPKDTKFEYTDDGRPDVSKLGLTTAKVKVTYPNGNTVTVEVPITVVKSVDGIEYNPEDVIPFNPTDLDNPNNPIKRPEGFIKVTFEADAGIRLTEPKAYYVRKNAKDKKGNLLKISALQKPSYELAQGYGFGNWDDDTITIGESDIVVRARANRVVKPDDKPSYPEVIYRDKIVEKEKIVEKIVKVGENDELLKEIRYMQGFNGKFRPYDGLTRAEAAQILANALKADGYRYDANYALSYTDVGSKWYTDAVRVVTQAGVFQGYSDGTFKPEGKITRAEWVATLRRFQDLKEANGNTMMLRSNHWATAEVEAAYEAGWLGVYQNGIAKFDADKPITRQEVAYVSNRAFRRVLDKVYLKRSVNTLLTYKDINPSMPLYEDILCASNTLLTDNRYYKANTVVMDNLTFNIVTDYLRIQQKKFQYNVIR